MRRQIRGSVVVITGASSGIGKCAALEFAKEGANLVLAARREEALEETARQCETHGIRAIAVPTDVSKEEEVNQLCQKAIDTFGRVDVWVNDAGVGFYGKVEDTSMDVFHQVIHTNLLGVVHGCKAVVPVMKSQGSGVIVNIASVVGKMGAPYFSAYCASKFGVVGFSQSLRMELMQDAPNVHVCTVMPGATDTPFFQHAGNVTGRAVKAMLPLAPPETVARVIVQMAKSPRREVVIGLPNKQQVAMRGVSLPLAEKMFAKQVEKNQFDNRSESANHGSVFAPADDVRSISGGWERQRAQTKAMAAGGVGVAGFAFLAVLAAGAWYVLRSSNAASGYSSYDYEGGNTAYMDDDEVSLSYAGRESLGSYTR